MICFQEARAGIRWECRVTGEVLSTPILERNRFVFEFRGRSIAPEFDDFCSDRIDVVQTLKLLMSTFDMIGRPAKGSVITLVEYKTEDDLGHGLVQWRAFKSNGTW